MFPSQMANALACIGLASHNSCMLQCWQMCRLLAVCHSRTWMTNKATSGSQLENRTRIHASLICEAPGRKDARAADLCSCSHCSPQGTCSAQPQCQRCQAASDQCLPLELSAASPCSCRHLLLRSLKQHKGWVTFNQTTHRLVDRWQLWSFQTASIVNRVSCCRDSMAEYEDTVML